MIRVFWLVCVSLYILNASEFHRSISSSPNRINPLLAIDSASSEITDWLFNGLVKFDKNANIVPDLAKSWKFENNTTLIFKLKENIKWHDGVKFTAEDVIYTYNLLSSKKLTTPYSSSFKDVKSVELIDKFTIKVVYKKPYFKALNIWMMGILPKHLWEKEKKPMQSKLNKFAIGTGAYKMIKAFEVNKQIVLVANKEYYEGKPKIDKIIYHFVGDESTNFLMLKANKLDISSLSPMQVDRQLNKEFKENFNIYERASNSYTYMGLNLRKAPFNNPKIREAIALAVNKQELIDLLFFSHAKECSGPFMPGTNVYPKDFKPLGYNPKKAQELLKELGYTKSNPLEFTISTSSSDIRVKAAEVIQQQLLKIGVKAKIRVMEWQAFLNTVIHPRKFEAMILGWSMPLTPDAYSLWHSKADKKGGFNLVGYHNSKVDKLITKAKSEIDRDKFGKIYQEIFKTIVKENPYIFLFIPNSITSVNKKVKGVEPSVIGIEHNFKDWTIDR